MASQGRARWMARRENLVCDDDVLVRALSIYMGRPLHPLVAYILAYEDATGTGHSGLCSWQRKARVTP